MKVFSKIMKILFTVLCFFLFLAQTTRILSSYFEYSTSVSTKAIGLKGLKFPKITICPRYGFDKDSLHKLGYDENYDFLFGNGNGGVKGKKYFGWSGLSGEFKPVMDAIEEVLM